MMRKKTQRPLENEEKEDKDVAMMLALIDGELSHLLDEVAAPSKKQAKCVVAQARPFLKEEGEDPLPPAPSSSSRVADMAMEQMRYLRELQAAGVHEIDGIPIELLLMDQQQPSSSSSLCAGATAAAAGQVGYDDENAFGACFDFIGDAILEAPPPPPSPPPPVYLPVMVVEEEKEEQYDEYPHVQLALLPPDHDDYSSSSCTCRPGTLHDPRTGCRYVETTCPLVDDTEDDAEDDDAAAEFLRC